MTPSRSTYFSKKVALLNVIATLMIVVHHAETPLRWGQSLDWQSYPFIWAVYALVQVAVPLFFFLSALLFYRNCEWKDIPKKLYRRIFSLLIPFLIWNAFFVFVYWALGKFPFTADRMNMPASLDTPIQWIDAVWNTRFTPLWFIKDLIYFCLLSPAILLIIKNKWVGIAVAVGVLAASVLLHWNGMSSLLYWLPVYLTGALVGKYLHFPSKDENIRLFAEWSQSKRTLLAALLSLLLIALYVWAVADESSWTYSRFVGPIAIWLLADIVLPIDFKDTFRVRDWMGFTFFIYATHYFLLNVEQTLVRSFLPDTPLVLNLTFIVTPIVTLFIIIWTARFLSRFTFYKCLTGGR